MISRLSSAVLLAVLTCLQIASATTTTYVSYTESDGDTVYLADNRRPSLYTGDFGDCLGNSLVNVTRFDAAYYQDNMTVLFHLEGNTDLVDAAVMMYIGVYAYGESRFDLTFNPCNANIDSACPMNSTVPIEAAGIIPVAESDVSSFPSIAFSIPDFEGQAILRIFANATETEIGCYSAVITNGNTFSKPESVGTILGIFTVIALIGSFATAIYGESVEIMRTHYAHSLSVGVVFAVFQHIFFTGALSMNWPSVLVAWWSNFAWAGGIIHSTTMQNSINKLIGNNIGNTTEVGAAESGSTQSTLGGGYDISQIYKRGLSELWKRNIAADIYQRDHGRLLTRDYMTQNLEHTFARRDLVNSSDGYSWYGSPVGAGLPLPGNYSGFAGTLAQEGIRVSNAFMTGFLWFLILLLVLVGAVVIFKWTIEGLVRIKALQQHRLAFFRKHWTSYTAQVALRTCYIAWFMIMFYTIFEFSYDSSAGVKVIAALVFLIFFIGTIAVVLYAYIFRAGQAAAAANPDRVSPDTKKQRLVETFRLLNPKSAAEQEKGISVSRSLRRWAELGKEPNSIHEDEDYVKRFGWLAARFRRSKWWFFGFWTLYEFVRACFYAGASGHPMTQVFGLLIVEILAFVFVAWVRPFEGRRLNIIVVYLLGFSKVMTVALSAAFDISFNLARITTTAIGIVIIVIQGLLVIVTLIAIVVGAISSYMSLTRNRDEFWPKGMTDTRTKYFYHLDRTARELPRPRKPQPPPPEEDKGPYFNVASVRRLNKIEDEDPNHIPDPAASYLSINSRSVTPAAEKALIGNEPATPSRRSRAVSFAQSNHSRNSLPFGARQHRPSWTARDFQDFYDAQEHIEPVDMNQNVPEDGTSRVPSPAPSTTTAPAINLLKKSSRSATMPSSMPQHKPLRPMVSMDSLKVGGEFSSHDTIGAVPMPVIRPRSGTWTGRTPSRAGSRTSTPTHSMYEPSLADYPPMPFPKRTSSALEVPGERRNTILAPTEEGDETLSRSVSKEIIRDKGKQKA